MAFGDWSIDPIRTAYFRHADLSTFNLQTIFSDFDQIFVEFHVEKFCLLCDKKCQTKFKAIYRINSLFDAKRNRIPV